MALGGVVTPKTFEERATDIACERENVGFDNYVDMIQRALEDAYVAGTQCPACIEAEERIAELREEVARLRYE